MQYLEIAVFNWDRSKLLKIGCYVLSLLFCLVWGHIQRGHSGVTPGRIGGSDGVPGFKPEFV